MINAQDLLIILVALGIFGIMIRQMRPAPKRYHQGKALTAFSSAKVFSNQWLYFNDSHVIICHGGETTVVAFDDIIALQKSGLRINNIDVWDLVVRVLSKKQVYSFRPNRKFWKLYQMLMQTHPTVIKSTWHRWI